MYNAHRAYSILLVWKVLVQMINVQMIKALLYAFLLHDGRPSVRLSVRPSGRTDGQIEREFQSKTYAKQWL